MVEQLLGHALEVVSDWLMVLEGRRIIYTNKGLLEGIKQPSDRVLGRQLEQVFPSKVCKGLYDLMEEMARREGRVVSASIDCEEPLLTMTSFAVRGETRGGYTFLSMQRRGTPEGAPDRLQEVEDRLAALLSLTASAGIGFTVFVLGPDGRLSFRSFNEHFIRILGMDEEELRSVDPMTLVHPEDQPRTRKVLEELMESGITSGSMQLRIIDGEGDSVLIQLSFSMLSPPQENTGIGFVLDMTPVQEALDQQNRMVQAIERVEDTVILTDATGTITYANPAALRNSGYTFEEVVGKSITIFHSPEAVDKLYQEAMGELVAKGMWRGDLMACTKDGTRYPVEVAGSLVRDASGIPKMIIVISRKTQERHAYESQLLISKSNAEHIHELHQYRFLPALQGAVEELEAMSGTGTVDAGEVARNAAVLRQALQTAEETVQRLPSPDRASKLRPFAIAAAIDEWIPFITMITRGRGFDTEIRRRPGDEDILVQANEVLASLVSRLTLALVMTKPAPKALEISVSSLRSSDIPGTVIRQNEGGGDITFGAITIRGPGLRISEAIRRDLRRKDLGTKGFAPAPASPLMETSRLVTFLFNGQVLVQGPGEGSGDDKGYRVIVLVPGAG